MFDVLTHDRARARARQQQQTHREYSRGEFFGQRHWTV